METANYYVPVKLEAHKRIVRSIADPEKERKERNGQYAERLIRTLTFGQFCVPYVELTSERLYSEGIPTTEISNKTIQTVWPTNPEYFGEHGRIRPETPISRELRNAKEA